MQLFDGRKKSKNEVIKTQKGMPQKEHPHVKNILPCQKTIFKRLVLNLNSCTTVE